MSCTNERQRDAICTGLATTAEVARSYRREVTRVDKTRMTPTAASTVGGCSSTERWEPPGGVRKTSSAVQPGLGGSVAVLGAGLAGLTAAASLVRDGFDVTVYEARDRVGGRVWSESIDGPSGPLIIERGAEFVLFGYSEMRRLLKEYGLGLVETGMSYYVRDVGDMEDVSTDDIIAAGREALTFVGDDAHEKSLSAADVLRGVGEERLAEALRARIEISAAAEATEVSASALHHIASIEPRPSWRIGGGNQSLPNAIADELGDRVHLGEAVDRLDHDAAGVTVTTTRETKHFDAVVVALPLAVLRGQASLCLDLPDWKRDALDRLVQGHAAKLHMVLAEQPETSAVMSVRDRFWTWTANSQDGSVAPVLNCFMGSLKALNAYGRDGLRSGWQRAVGELRGDLWFESGADAVLTTWSDDHLSGGAYAALDAAATLADIEAIRRPVGAVFFAGEYADPDFTGLMEGAIRSGLHAAAGIISTFVPGVP